MNLSLKDSKLAIEEQINSLLEQHYFEESKFSCQDKHRLAKDFQETSYILIKNFVPTVIETAIKGEVYDLLDKYSTRRNVRIPVTGNTPRIMSNVGQPTIKQNSQIISALYHSPVLMRFLSEVVGKSVIVCPYEKEKFVITKMSQKGDTHGWHWDDYSYSLVWFMETPPPELGGFLEIVPNTSWDKNNPSIDYYLSNFSVQRKYHVPGDVYLIKADTTMHRVAPLKEDTSRVILNMAWANEDDLSKEISHETMKEMYDY